MKIAIFGQYYQNNTHEIVEKVTRFLREKSCDLYIYEKFLNKLLENSFVNPNLKTYSCHEDLQNQFDFVISIGGDGTILRAATLVQDLNIPIIGINAGRLGFLATIQEENIEFFLEKIYTKEYTISKRALVNLETSPENKNIGNINFALNEITVSRKDTTSMITIETFINDEYLNSYWADGLIISTPTGSTGYSLSCGGPVLMPTANCLVITPIAPHTLTARPLVIPDNVEIRLKVTGREEQFLVSMDSRIASISNETQLTIKKAPFEILMVEFQEERFLKTIRKKLLWGEDKRN
jgi:NAD+ kinase